MGIGELVLARGADVAPLDRARHTEEQALVRSACAGDASAFGTLVGAYQDVAYSVAYRILGHGDSAADATQEAFLAAYRGLGTYQGGSFKAWILRIVTNACYDQLRRRRCRRQVSLEDTVEDADHASWLADPGESPEEAVVRGDVAAAIEAALARLSLEQRAVLVLSDVQELSYAEIAEIMGTSLGTVRSRLSRARSRLRDVLAASQGLSA